MATPRGSVADALEAVGIPGEPVTADELAAELDCEPETARDRLDALAHRDEVASKELPTGDRVWWSTDRERRERELERYEAVVETINDGIYVKDSDNRFTLVNRTYAEMAGYEPEELVGRDSSFLVSDEVMEAAEQLYSDLLEGDRESETIEATLETGDGEPVETEASFAVIERDDDHERVGVVRDVTERKERERRLERQKERLESFASMLAHELRNPVTIGQIYAQQLPVAAEGAANPDGATASDAEGVPNPDGAEGATDSDAGAERESDDEDERESDDEGATDSDAGAERESDDEDERESDDEGATDPAPEPVEHVRDAFDRIEDMIDVLLVLARGGEAVGEPEPVALADAAREAWTEVEAPDATLDVATDRVVAADETYVRHVFENLLENAVEHGSTGSQPTAGDAVEHGSTRSQSSADDAVEYGGVDVTVTVGDLPDGFYVADDGTGIPEEKREQVFEAGYTTAETEGGTGVGLTFVEELAETYGWDCTVTESETGGARFEFRNVDEASA